MEKKAHFTTKMTMKRRKMRKNDLYNDTVCFFWGFWIEIIIGKEIKSFVFHRKPFFPYLMTAIRWRRRKKRGGKLNIVVQSGCEWRGWINFNWRILPLNAVGGFFLSSIVALVLSSMNCIFFLLIRLGFLFFLSYDEGYIILGNSNLTEHKIWSFRLKEESKQIPSKRSLI